MTSGNLGGFGRELEDLGVEVDDDFYTSVLANDHVTVVAAVDETSDPIKAPEEAA